MPRRPDPTTDPTALLPGSPDPATRSRIQRRLALDKRIAVDEARNRLSGNRRKKWPLRRPDPLLTFTWFQPREDAPLWLNRALGPAFWEGRLAIRRAGDDGNVWQLLDAPTGWSARASHPGDLMQLATDMLLWRTRAAHLIELPGSCFGRTLYDRSTGLWRHLGQLTATLTHLRRTMLVVGTQCDCRACLGEPWGRQRLYVSLAEQRAVTNEAEARRKETQRRYYLNAKLRRLRAAGAIADGGSTSLKVEATPIPPQRSREYEWERFFVPEGE